MQSRITGSVLPVLHVSLDPGERLISETGELSWKSPNVSLRTTMGGGGLFMTEYAAEGAPGFIAIAARIPGVIEDSVDFTITMLPGLRNKLFGGDGFFLARLTGPGRIWLQTLTLPNLAHALSPYMPRAG